MKHSVLEYTISLQKTVNNVREIIGTDRIGFKLLQWRNSLMHPLSAAARTSHLLPSSLVPTVTASLIYFTVVWWGKDVHCVVCGCGGGFFMYIMHLL